VSTILTSPSRPASIASETSVSGGTSDLFTRVADFFSEAGYVANLIGQAFRASREAPEAYPVKAAVILDPWIAWPGDITSV
jgi:hypothetical protein